jgi:hypothetical protein
MPTLLCAPRIAVSVLVREVHVNDSIQRESCYILYIYIEVADDERTKKLCYVINLVGCEHFSF